MKVQACLVDGLGFGPQYMHTRALLLDLRARNKDPRCIPRAMKKSTIFGLEKITFRSAMFASKDKMVVKDRIVPRNPRWDGSSQYNICLARVRAAYMTRAKHLTIINDGKGSQGDM